MKAELLSPAGSYEILEAVFNAGADAVYAGGEKFGARAYAKNFSENDLLKSIDYAHIYNKNFYLTLNTLLKNNEIKEELFNYILPLYKEGLDAVIVQDLGVFEFIKTNFPELEIHASTQMTITGRESAKIIKDLGAKRIVTARELSLKEIKDIHDNVDIEIESFVHGALCYAYSGQCMLSSMLGGRSANRGRCAGPCRLPYSTNGNEKKYPLSLKDLCAIELLPEIIDSGVYSLKIEGRMKKLEYAAGVTRIYRKYLDILLEKGSEKYNVTNEDLNELLSISNRSGYTKGYYFNHNSKKMVTLDKPNYDSNYNFIPDEKKYVKIDCKVDILRDREMKISISGKNEITFKGKMPEIAKKAPLSKETVIKQLTKIKDTQFEFRNIDINLDENLFVPVKELNDFRRNAIDDYIKMVLDKYKRNSTCENKVDIINNNKIYEKQKLKINCKIDSHEQFTSILKYKEVHSLYINYDSFKINQLDSIVNTARENNKKVYVLMPTIFRQRTKDKLKEQLNIILKTKINGFLIRNFEEYGFLKKYCDLELIADSNFYVFNDYSAKVLNGFGFSYLTLPYELNYKELKRLNCSDMEIIVYGYQELMNSANCIKKTFNACDSKNGYSYIKDRYNKAFIVKNNCDSCNNTIYNCNPISLISQKDKILDLNVKSVRLEFTCENSSQTEEILNDYINTFLGGAEKYIEIKNFTKGHFNRGVE